MPQQFATEKWRRYMEDQPVQDSYLDRMAEIERKAKGVLANPGQYESYGMDPASEPWYEQWIRYMEPISRQLREVTPTDLPDPLGFAGGAGPAVAGKGAQFLQGLLSKLGNQTGYVAAKSAPTAARMAKKRALPGTKQAQGVASQLTDDLDMLKYFTPGGGYNYSDLVSALRRNFPLQDELLNAPEDIFDLGVKSGQTARAAFQDLRQWRRADNPRIQAALSSIDELIGRGKQGVTELARDLQGAVPAAGKAVADWFPTAGRSLPEELGGLVERGGRAVADVGSRLTEDIRKQGWLDPRDRYWAQKLQGGPRKRYQASGAKNVPEGSDLWQRDILKDYYRDIKPTASRVYSEDVAPFLQEWGPVAKVGGQGAALLAAMLQLPSGMPDPEGKLQPAERWREIWSGPPASTNARGVPPPPGYWDTALSLINPWER